MSTPSPSQDPELWNGVGMGTAGVLPPRGTGSCKVTCKASQKIDEKSPAGKKGASSTQQGENEPEFTIALKFVEAAWPAIEVAIEYLLPPRGPVDVVHPTFRLYKTTAVQISEISGPDWDDHQIGTISITCKRWTESTADGTCTTLLYQGVVSAEVRRWKEFLLAQGYAPGTVDSTFDAACKTATQAFQTAQGIKVDGIVGPQTFGAAGKLGYAAPPPKACGSATKTATSADETQFGPPTPTAAERLEYARQDREAYLAAADAAGITPNEDGWLPPSWSDP